MLPDHFPQSGFHDLWTLLLKRLTDEDWVSGPPGWRAPFLPVLTGAWTTFPALDDLFNYNGSGVQPMRVWVIAPDKAALNDRWQALIEAPVDRKEVLFHPTMRNGLPADRTINSVVKDSIPDYLRTLKPLSQEQGKCPPPASYAFRPFDRQWIIPDMRVVTQPNKMLWRVTRTTHCS
jgi:type ISP restriction-modification system protein